MEYFLEKNVDDKVYCNPVYNFKVLSVKIFKEPILKKYWINLNTITATVLERFTKKIPGEVILKISLKIYFAEVSY